jgi:hypothetical protein
MFLANSPLRGAHRLQHVRWGVGRHHSEHGQRGGACGSCGPVSTILASKSQVCVCVFISSCHYQNLSIIRMSINQNEYHQNEYQKCDARRGCLSFMDMEMNLYRTDYKYAPTAKFLYLQTVGFSVTQFILRKVPMPTPTINSFKLCSQCRQI